MHEGKGMGAGGSASILMGHFDQMQCGIQPGILGVRAAVSPLHRIQQAGTRLKALKWTFYGDL